MQSIKQHNYTKVKTLQLFYCGVLIFLFNFNISNANSLDSLSSMDSLKIDVINIEENQNIENDSLELESIVVIKSKSPTTALYYSIIPGLGQYYVESYWKAPLFFGGAASLTGLMIYFNNEFISDRDKIETMLNPYSNQYTSENNVVRSNEKHISLENFTYDKSEFTYLKNRREFNRDNRDRMGFFLGVLYLVSAVDAYVDANLYNFNVDNNLTYFIIPNVNNGISVNLTYKF